MSGIIEIFASDAEAEPIHKRPRWRKGLLRAPFSLPGPPPMPPNASQVRFTRLVESHWGNPVDLFFDIVQEMLGHAVGVWISWDEVLRQVQSYGLTPEMAQTAFEN